MGKSRSAAKQPKRATAAKGVASAQHAKRASALGSGATVSATGRVLDVRPDRLDFRDLPYRPPLRSLAPVWPPDAVIAKNLAGYIGAKLVRDQGDEGACTGFGLSCVANYLLWIRHAQSGVDTPFESVSPRMLYDLARRYDEWKGVDYEGSSCRGALKGWNKHGACSESFWPFPLSKGKPVFVPPQAGWEKDAATRPLGVYYRVDKNSIVDLQAALNDIGAVYCSADAHDGWDALQGTRRRAAPVSHVSLPSIPAVTDPKSTGGHAFAIVGYNTRGFVVQNSWGETWGARGFAVLPYDDWVNNGTDAWVCALGVPVELSNARLALSRYRVPVGRSLDTRGKTPQNPANPSDDPWPIDHPFKTPSYQPWTSAKAYLHTLVSGNDGVLLPSDVGFGVGVDPESYATKIVVDEPLAWFKAQGGGAAKLMLYAHGGLNSEDESLQRIRVLAPYAEANGIYPLFLTWKTGPIETLENIFEDYFGGRPELGPGPAGAIFEQVREGADLMIEATSHLILRGVWSEMRGNAEFSTQSGRAIDLLAKKLVVLRDQLQGRPLELHLVGHSAGSIVLGWLLDRATRPDLLPSVVPIASCTLFAAACSLQFALGTYAKAARTPAFDLKKLWVYYLTDDNERADGLPTGKARLYGKSLLYLVSRALDDARKMPLLGLQRALDPAHLDPRDWASEQLATVSAWQQLWSPSGGGAKPHGFAVTERDVRVTATGKTIQATHGSFDNNIHVVTQSFERIRGSPLIAPIEWLDY